MMISTTYAMNMAAYNRWMNARVYDCSTKLSDEERKRDVGAFFRSIHGTLNHLLLADRLWLGRFTGQPFTALSLDQELHADFDELRKARLVTDELIVQWAGSLSDESLAGELRYTSMVNPQPRRCPFWLAVAHLFNHQTHHRGQVTTLLWQRGIDPGVTDLLALPGAQFP